MRSSSIAGPGTGRRAGPWGWVAYGAGIVLLAALAFTVTHAFQTRERRIRPGDSHAAWWRPGVLDSTCTSGTSPAQMIDALHQLGAEPKAIERKTLTGDLASVEVDTHSDAENTSEDVTFYRHQKACEESRAANQLIPQAYN